MSYPVSEIANIIKAKLLQRGDDAVIGHLLIDSRTLIFPANTLFFALPGKARNGDLYIKQLFEKGVRNFVSGNNNSINKADLPGSNILVVDDVLEALQLLAACHRRQFQYPVIGITGSNGKTIVKEWLSQLLGEDYNIVRSPKSYNSQVGVPLSVWRMNENNDLAVFEAGISAPNEMKKLQEIIDPTIGIVTFIGNAHAEGFSNEEEKIAEKLLLFKNSQQLICCADDQQLLAAVKELTAVKNKSLQIFTWSKKSPADLFAKEIKKQAGKTEITCIYKEDRFQFTIPLTDDASVNNALSCCAVMLVLKISTAVITQKMLQLRPLEMRLELKQGINNCSVINDSYSADINSLGIALDFLGQQQQHKKRTVILSDLLETGPADLALYQNIALILKGTDINRFIGIGPHMRANAAVFSALNETRFFDSTDSFLANIAALHFSDETILLKGARIFRFEKISRALEHKAHETLLEINLNALRHNLKIYRDHLGKSVRIMAMVKAFSYGSGSFEIANLLQHAGAEYLAVAYADEGADLRSNGITLPIMVMNTEAAGFESIIKNKLEPELYSFGILKELRDYLAEHGISQLPVHIKIDTGMHRLGFDEADINALCGMLKDESCFRVVSVFSHLAAGDAEMHDEFTVHQSNIFNAAADKIAQALGYTFLRHISNSSAVYRHPQLQLDMVRLGIGLYGVDASPAIQQRLQPVTTLKTTISQIKNISQGESVGYSRKGIAAQDTKIATVQIGYADGYPRALSNGKGKMLVNGNAAPVIGNICMDMTMLDITGIDAEEGDEVIVFGEEPSVTAVAAWADTISYEILTNISQRVKRVYFEE